MKVNYRKVTWCAKRVKFLGFHLEEGKIKIRDYLEGKWKALTQVNNIQQLERAIGILSYCRRSILGVGRIIEPLNKKLIEVKKFGMDEEGWKDVSELVEEAFRQAMDRVTDRLSLGQGYSGVHIEYRLGPRVWWLYSGSTEELGGVAVGGLG